MHAPDDSTAPWRPIAGMRRLIRPWEYRHRHAVAGVRFAAGGFNLGVGVDERQSELGRKPLADRGFSGPHHADENHRAAAERGRHPPGVDRLALTHELFHSPKARVRAVPYRTPAANARLAGAPASPAIVNRLARRAGSCNHVVRATASLQRSTTPAPCHKARS